VDAKERRREVAEVRKDAVAARAQAQLKADQVRSSPIGEAPSWRDGFYY
jgi:hypothetical protein